MTQYFMHGGGAVETIRWMLRPGHTDDADHEASLADVGDVAEDVHRRLKQRQHSEGRSNLNRNITLGGKGEREGTWKKAKR